MGWRRLVVGALLALWVAVAIAWGVGAALLLAYPVFLAWIFTTWVVLAGRLDQRAAAWYYERQLQAGPWRDRARRRG